MWVSLWGSTMFYNSMWAMVTQLCEYAKAIESYTLNGGILWNVNDLYKSHWGWGGLCIQLWTEAGARVTESGVFYCRQ